MTPEELLTKVKENLIIEHTADDALITGYIAAAVSYAESYQHREAGFYETHAMSAHTEQGVVMLASHFYESRDGGTGGFFSGTVGTVERIWNAVNTLLRLDREWKV